MAETAAAPAPAAEKTQVVRPTRPDESAFQKALTEAEKAHKASMDKLVSLSTHNPTSSPAYRYHILTNMGGQNAIKAKIELAVPNKNKDQPTPTQQRRQELISQANEIRAKQAGGKNARTTKLDQIKRLDEQVRSRVNEQKSAKAKVPYKTLEEVDRQIETLDRQVNSGSMKLVDEKKALSDISNLRKVRKNFGQFDDAQRQIDELRAKIKEIKDTMEDPEQKALSEQYNTIQAELDAIKAEQDEAYKGLSSLRDERSKLQAEQQDKYTAIRKLKDDYYGQKKAFQAYEREARDKQREKRKAEHDKYVADRKKADAERVLAEASDPAYLEEIRRANSLLLFLDPSHKVEKGPLMADSGLGAQAQRKVDDADLKGTRLLRKEDREDEYLPAVRKGKKGKKTGAAAAPSTKAFSCPPSVVEDSTFIGVDPPMSSEDVPSVIEKVRAKLDHWKADQEAQTQRVSHRQPTNRDKKKHTNSAQNIEKAKKKIEELEKAEANGTNGTNGADEVAADLKETTIADKEES